MGQELLVADQITAGEEFVREFNDNFPVSVAFWLVAVDSDDPYFFVASDGIDDGNIDTAYGEVVRIFQGNRKPWLDPFQIKLINSKDPMAVDAVKIRDRFSAPLPTRYGGATLGGRSIEGAYIYPALSATKPTS